MPLHVNILRHAPSTAGMFDGDSSNNGVTSLSRCPEQRALLFGEDEEIPSTFPPGYAHLQLRRREGWMGNIAVPIPAETPREAQYAGPMFGGCFVYASDSRFNKLTGSPAPLPVHDRFDTWADYARNSD